MFLLFKYDLTLKIFFSSLLFLFSKFISCISFISFNLITFFSFNDSKSLIFFPSFELLSSFDSLTEDNFESE